MADELIGVGNLGNKKRLKDMGDGTVAEVVSSSDVVDTGAAITGQALEAGGSGILGWLSSVRKAITDRLPAALVGGRLDVNLGADSTGTVTYAHTQPSIAAATTLALAANASRKYALFINDSSADIYLKVGASAVLHQGILLTANGGSFEMSLKHGNLDASIVNAIATAAGSALLVTEG